MGKMNPWSQAVARYLEANNIPQAKFAAQVDVAPSTVSYWCAGKVARRDALHRVAKVTKGVVPAHLAVA